MDAHYSPQSRAERLIAPARLILAGFSLAAIWLDPSEPARYVQVTYSLLTAYLVYAGLMALLVWRSPDGLVSWRLPTHAFDLIVFFLLMYFTEGPVSPFFVYFVFSVVCATLRWQWEGALWTSVVALVVFLGMGVYATEISRNPAFELNRFIIRSSYLAVVAGLLSYLGAYQQQLQGELGMLAAWPRQVSSEVDNLVQAMLTHAATILGVQRLLLAWEEPDEPWLRLGWWDHGEYRRSDEAPDTFEPLVAKALAGGSFLCPDVRVATPTVLYASPTGMHQWRGTPLHPALQARFNMGPVLALSLNGESLKGYLLALDKPRMTSDDLVLGDIVVRQVAADMDQNTLIEQRQQAAAVETGFRLALDLHDGLLSVLGGVNLQLSEVQRLIHEDPEAASELLGKIQALLTAEQRDLRFMIEDLKSVARGVGDLDFDLAARLEQLVDRIERQRGLRVQLHKDALEGLQLNGLARDIYFIVNEALTNAARHSRASMVRVEIGRQNQQLCLTITDNGRGFSFRGHYDMATLSSMNLGPFSLRERIGALRGTLSIDSTESGARLEILLPLPRPGV